MGSPFNTALHSHLTSIGYEHIYHPPEFDEGDAENGPGTHHCPAYDEYTGPDEVVFCNSSGTFFREARDLELEKWLEDQGIT